MNLPFIKNIIEKWYLKMDGNRVYYDHMTGLRSREYYDEIAIQKYESITVRIIYIDIDFLKKVNDTKGHAEGTQLIKNIARDLIKLSMSDNKIFDICRVGGDEFVMFTDTSFDPKTLDDIKESISYGYVDKLCFLPVEKFVDDAERYMYRHKNRKHKRKCNL